MAATNRYFPSVEKFPLSQSLVERTLDALQAEGQFRVESLVFWAGTVTDGLATVTDVFVPKGPGVFKHPLQVRVSDELIAVLCGRLDPPRLVLLGQVHTHMGAAFHSPSDDRFSMDTPGYISIVVPSFARADMAAGDGWAFYECEGRGRFRPVEAEERVRRFPRVAEGEVTVHAVYA